MQQKLLFDNKELQIRLRKLTDKQVKDLAIQHFGNLFYYHEKQIMDFAKYIQKEIEGKNK